MIESYNLLKGKQSFNQNVLLGVKQMVDACLLVSQHHVYQHHVTEVV